MEDELVLSLDGKNLGNLRVVDLKQQLEKRGLSKSGSKKDLVKRLKLQLEFEKLGEERKLGAGGDLKLELDAATEQNEFVRQYLARQQKLLAEQNTSDHSSESEEIQNTDDEQCDSPHVQESNEIISETDVSKSGDSENKTCVTENQKFANLKEDTDNIASRIDKKGEDQDTNALIMPSSKDLSTSNVLRDQNQTHTEKADCSSVPYSLSDIQLPESPKKGSTKSNSEKESRKLVAEKEAMKIVVLKQSAKSIAEKETKPVPKKESTKSGVEEEFPKFVAEKESSKSVAEKESSKSVAEKESSKSVAEKESSKFVAEKESSKSVVEKDSSKSVTKKELTKSLTEREASKSGLETQHVENETKTSTITDQMNTNGLQVSNNSTVSKSPSLSKSESSAHSLKPDNSNQNIKPSKNNQNSNEKQTEKVVKSRNYSTDEKDSISEEKESEILEHKAFSKKSSRKPEPESSKKVSKEISEKKKTKVSSKENTNESSSDSGEYKSDVETKMVKASPTRDVKRRHSRSESSSESSSSESSEISPKELSKIPVKKPKIDVIEKTDEIKKKYSVSASQDAVEKTIVGDEKTKNVSSCHTKQKLKIKRDNVVLEEHISSKHESSTEKNVLQTETRLDASKNKDAQHEIQSFKPKDPEITEEAAKPYVSRKVTLSNRKQSRSSMEEAEDSSHKKSKWGSFATAQKNSRNISISTSSLKNWFPDFKLINEPVSTSEATSMEQTSTLSEEKFINQMSENEVGTHKQTLWLNDPIEQDTPLEEEPIEQGPVSKIIFMQNLVRPFTLSQLKDLLKQHGNFIEGQFWIDKIKSKCIVVYETEEASAKAKNALNNSRWPPSNPKILTVQYINEEEIEFLKRGSEPPKIVPEVPVEAIECYDVKTVAPIEESRKKDREHKRDKEKARSQVPLREWDKDKIVQDSPERMRFVNKENEKIKAVEKKERKESKRRQNDDTPAKLLDDLFQKTKSSPCIYWLPLTEEQIRERAEEKRMKRLEYEKRNLKEQEGVDRKNKIIRSGHRSRERELQRSSSRSRSPVSRRR